MKWLSLILLTLPLSATAYELHSEYRIYGDEIASVVAPHIEIEAPMSLIITTTQGREILIESDQPLETCQRNLERAQGDASASVRIVVNERADTMNGVEVVQCSVLYH